MRALVERPAGRGQTRGGIGDAEGRGQRAELAAAARLRRWRRCRRRRCASMQTSSLRHGPRRLEGFGRVRAQHRRARRWPRSVTSGLRRQRVEPHLQDVERLGRHQPRALVCAFTKASCRSGTHTTAWRRPVPAIDERMRERPLAAGRRRDHGVASATVRERAQDARGRGACRAGGRSAAPTINGCRRAARPRRASSGRVEQSRGARLTARPQVSSPRCNTGAPQRRRPPARHDRPRTNETTRDTPPRPALRIIDPGSLDRRVGPPSMRRRGPGSAAGRRTPCTDISSGTPDRGSPPRSSSAPSSRCRRAIGAAARLRRWAARCSAPSFAAHMPPLAASRGARRPRRRRAHAGHPAHHPAGRLPAGRRPPRRLPVARRRRRARARFRPARTSGCRTRYDRRGQAVPVSVPRRRLRRRWPGRGRAAAGAAAPPECPRRRRPHRRPGLSGRHVDRAARLARLPHRLPALRAHALDEPLPAGTGWSFTTGSVVALLIGVQFVTGVGLAMYYVPSPSLAYDSLRYLITAGPSRLAAARRCMSGAPASSSSPRWCT